jgi:hypothetical protein
MLYLLCSGNLEEGRNNKTSQDEAVELQHRQEDGTQRIGQAVYDQRGGHCDQFIPAEVDNGSTEVGKEIQYVAKNQASGLEHDLGRSSRCCVTCSSVRIRARRVRLMLKAERFGKAVFQ